MKLPLVADGPARLLKSEGHRKRQSDLLESIQAKYAAQLANADAVTRFRIRWRIRSEYKAELRKIQPSATALYSWAGRR
jgi:hypothetical protein